LPSKKPLSARIPRKRHPCGNNASASVRNSTPPRPAVGLPDLSQPCRMNIGSARAAKSGLMGKPAGLARVVALLRAFLPATAIKHGGV
jgi:hypothetical protein